MDQIPSFKPVVRQVNPAVQNQLSAGMAKRVCAYCRVSTESVQQQSSYELQVSHYQDSINMRSGFLQVYMRMRESQEPRRKTEISLSK